MKAGPVETLRAVWPARLSLAGEGGTLAHETGPEGPARGNASVASTKQLRGGEGGPLRTPADMVKRGEHGLPKT
jgi:hypothetical protein